MTFDEVWSGLREFPCKGRYFELLSTGAAVNVKAYAADGKVLADEKGVQQGFWVDRRAQEPFERIEIDAVGGATAIKFLITDGMSGNRSVPADITDDAARLLGIVSVSDITDDAARVLGIVSVSATVAPAGLAYTNASKTAAVASAQILAALASRRYLLIQNQSLTEDAYISTDGSAATVGGDSLKLAPGQTWEPLIPPTGEIRAIRGAAADVTLHTIEA